jgi:hypothetical protein
MIDELVNDYCILGDDGAVIFASYDHVLEFVEKIRADERKRRTLAELLDSTPVDETVKHEYVLDCPRCGHCCQQREWVGFTDGEKQYLRALGFVGIDNIEERLKRMNT